MTAREDQDRAVATLRRIAFLLERAQASRYRAEAYRAAARTVEGQDAARLGVLARAGALTDLPAVGSSTAEVVSRTLAGRPVPALVELEEQAAAHDACTTPAAAALHAALRGDLHSHTDASDGATPVQEMVLAALELGRDYLAVTDHSPRLKIANGLSAPRLRAQLAQLAALRPAVAPFEVLSGIEVDILDDGSLDQDPDLLDELDVVVASVHSKLRMERTAMTRRMLTAVRDPRTDVLGHCTGRQVAGKHRPPSDFDARAVFDACAEHGVAVEINCRPDRLDPPHELLQLAADAGCTFTIDSDAHAPGQLDWLRAGCERAAAHGIGPDRVVTTRSAAEVRERSRR
ncbi:PHP domain-containing protein [Cellulomonas xiejunii]|uniref:PHP domain-containing protein n=1 Tax=Cellulomonas xiejunii TaxID=2968083 RepID=A0ABY5KLY5_9CELL|nr:PHP domain-containing protein [Cellulomonas xiejunii]MCC2319762.1 PHP domain-containing protein [Cellulomonas xiejunii]UUI70101.1 PHP domain-containing protein [Cellulomonas xiejunii]